MDLFLKPVHYELASLEDPEDVPTTAPSLDPVNLDPMMGTLTRVAVLFVIGMILWSWIEDQRRR
jgi:hypothetical protein